MCVCIQTIMDYDKLTWDIARDMIGGQTKIRVAKHMYSDILVLFGICLFGKSVARCGCNGKTGCDTSQNEAVK